MWGIIPAAGRASRIQPLVFSKELLPVGCRLEQGLERPCAVSEYLLERMLLAGADSFCFVISPGKSDIVEYYGDNYGGADIVYVVQPKAVGLCDALFRANPIIDDNDSVLVGLPDTIWFPEDALNALPPDGLSFLLFPVEHPELFDAVITGSEGNVEAFQVKQADSASRWIWGAFRMPGSTFHALRRLWIAHGCVDEYIGTLVNAYLAQGGTAVGLPAGRAYVDVGTLHGYRTAMTLLADMRRASVPGASPKGARFTDRAPPAALEHDGATP